MKTIDNYRWYGGCDIEKVGEIKAYSSECNPVHFSSSKYNDWRSQTHFYYVAPENFEKLSEKPELINVCRPVEVSATGFGYGEVTAKEVNGKGWEECYTDHFGKYHRNVYILKST